MAYAASDDQLKVFEAHTVGYNVGKKDVYYDGRLSEPFWPPGKDESW